MSESICNDLQTLSNHLIRVFDDVEMRWTHCALIRRLRYQIEFSWCFSYRIVDYSSDRSVHKVVSIAFEEESGVSSFFHHQKCELRVIVSIDRFKRAFNLRYLKLSNSRKLAITCTITIDEYSIRISAILLVILDKSISHERL